MCASRTFTIRLSKTSFETTWRVQRDAQNSTLNFSTTVAVLSAQLRAAQSSNRFARVRLVDLAPPSVAPRIAKFLDGGEGVRTPDLRLAKPALCQTELRPHDKHFHEGWLRGRDLNPRPLGYEPNELPDCSTPRHKVNLNQYGGPG